jgi:hypothetical protein
MISETTTPNDKSPCPNCSAPLDGPYCASCGQRQLDLEQPFRDLAGEAMESFLSFDARILRTLWPLVRRPGLLTVEYLAGRRIRYVHPFKLYFVFSVLLFLTLAISGYSVVRESGGAQGGSGVQVFVTVDEPAEEESTDKPDEPSTLDKVTNPIVAAAENDPTRLNKIFTERLAKSIIVLVPVFAALLGVLYRRRRYVAHLVFSLHLHSFAFMALVIGLMIDLGLGVREGKGLGNVVSVLVIAIYSFLALRRVYGQGRFLTFVKMQLLLLGYLVALIVTMMLTLAVTAVTV